MRKITVDFSDAGIRRLSRELEDCKEDIGRKVQELVNRLAQEGMEIAQFYFDVGVYDGKKDVTVRVEPRGDKCAAVIAEGNAVLFLEFGAGYLLGYGHPEPGAYGPGTYPGKGHWDDPGGWYLPKAAQQATGIEHSMGNPPTAAMYNAVKELERRIQEIAAEVFS